jgi:hypothetical protein
MRFALRADIVETAGGLRLEGGTALVLAVDEAQGVLAEALGA